MSFYLFYFVGVNPKIFINMTTFSMKKFVVIMIITAIIMVALSIISLIATY